MSSHRSPIDESGVTVCVCTFRRASVLSTLQSVARQIMPAGTRSKILVIDNDFSRAAEPVISNYCTASGIDFSYFHAPGQNISIARNAGLAACRTRWMAFIDDDEAASPQWLDRLLAGRGDGIVAVFGPCLAIYGDDTPKWIRVGDYHSNRISTRRGFIDTGYSSNVLIDMDFVRQQKLTFDEELGRTGGEDTFFFHAMYRRGGRLAYAQDAIVYDPVPSSRTTTRWIATRRYRAGQTFAKLQQQYARNKYRNIPLMAPLKITFCIAIGTLLCPRPSRAIWWLSRATFHLGMLAYWTNGKIHEEYSVPT
jgi:succinoglycan biosynthesis protein ExoM